LEYAGIGGGIFATPPANAGLGAKVVVFEGKGADLEAEFGDTGSLVGGLELPVEPSVVPLAPLAVGDG